MKKGDTQLIVEVARGLKKRAKIAAEIQGKTLRVFVAELIEGALKRMPQVQDLPVNGKKHGR